MWIANSHKLNWISFKIKIIHSFFFFYQEAPLLDDLMSNCLRKPFSIIQYNPMESSLSLRVHHEATHETQTYMWSANKIQVTRNFYLIWSAKNS